MAKTRIIVPAGKATDLGGGLVQINIPGGAQGPQGIPGIGLPGEDGDVDVMQRPPFTGYRQGPLTVGGLSVLGGGTAFPAGAKANDLFYRTDMWLWFTYTGTYWLGTDLRTQALMQVPLSVDGMVTGLTASTFFGFAPLRSPSGTWLERLEYVVQYAGGTINSSNYWRVDVVVTNPSTSRSVIYTGPNLSSDTAAQAASHSDSIGGMVDTLLGGAGAAGQRYEIQAVKVGSPPAINIVATVVYRVRAT